MTGEKLRPYDEKNNYIIEMGYRYVHIFNFYLVIYSFCLTHILQIHSLTHTEEIFSIFEVFYNMRKLDIGLT